MVRWASSTRSASSSESCRPTIGSRASGRVSGAQVVVGVDAAQIAEGDRLGGVDVVAVEQPRRVEEGEDALAALEVVGDPGQLDLVAPAVDELDAPRCRQAVGQPPPAPAPGFGEGGAHGRSGSLHGCSQPHPGGAPAAGFERRVAEGLHPRVAGEQRAHGLALHADPLAVDDAQLAEPLLPRRLEVLPHDVRHLGRPEAVQVEHVGDRQLDRSDPRLDFRIRAVLSRPLPRPAFIPSPGIYYASTPDHLRERMLSHAIDGEERAARTARRSCSG